MPFPEQDAQLAKLVLRDTKGSAINFTALLIHDCLFGSSPYGTREQFRYSLEALAQVVRNNKGTDTYVPFYINPNGD